MNTAKDSHLRLYLRYKNALETLQLRYLSQLKEPCGLWIYGAPFTGKDFDVLDYNKGDIYVKNINKWWDGYKTERIALISEVEPERSDFLGYLLKNMGRLLSFFS